MKTINLTFFILLLFTLSSQAGDMTIVNVRSNIPLSDQEPMYHDYVISSKDMGPLKKNLVVLVKRNMKMKNSDAKDIGDIETAVGQLKIIHVDKTIAIGREYNLVPRDNEVILDYAGVMVGDSIDTAGSFTDNKPLKKVDREPSSSNLEKPRTTESITPLNNPLLLPEI